MSPEIHHHPRPLSAQSERANLRRAERVREPVTNAVTKYRPAANVALHWCGEMAVRRERRPISTELLFAHRVPTCPPPIPLPIHREGGRASRKQAGALPS